MNYLLLTEYFPSSEQAEITGGVESRCFHLVKELSKKHHITVLCSKQPEQEKHSKVFNSEVLRCGPINPYSNKGSIIKRLLFAFSLYFAGTKLNNIDVVEGASFITYIPAYFIGKKHKAKKVATWHETWVGEWIKNKGIITGAFGEMWERTALKLNWDKIISVSNFTKDKLLEGNIKCKDIQVIPNGINLGGIQKIKATNYKQPTLVYFGRLSSTKNVSLIIKAVSELKNKIPNIRFNVLGDGSERNNLEILTKRLKLEDTVKFLGYYKDHEEMLREAKKAHLFVCASTLEGFGITIVEAMALGLPYVISNIQPFLEVTKNGAGGEIFQQNNAADLAHKIKLLLTNKRLYQQKIKEGKQSVKDYDWEDVFSNYVQDVTGVTP